MMATGQERPRVREIGLPVGTLPTGPLRGITATLLTTTLNVPRVADAAFDDLRGLPGKERVRIVNVVVGETNHGGLKEIRGNGDGGVSAFGCPWGAAAPRGSRVGLRWECWRKAATAESCGWKLQRGSRLHRAPAQENGPRHDDGAFAARVASFAGGRCVGWSG